MRLLEYSNDTAIVEFFRIPLGSFGMTCATVVSNNLALCLKDLKRLLLAKSILKLIASSLE